MTTRFQPASTHLVFARALVSLGLIGTHLLAHNEVNPSQPHQRCTLDLRTDLGAPLKGPMPLSLGQGFSFIQSDSPKPVLVQSSELGERASVRLVRSLNAREGQGQSKALVKVKSTSLPNGKSYGYLTCNTL